MQEEAARSLAGIAQDAVCASASQNIGYRIGSRPPAKPTMILPSVVGSMVYSAEISLGAFFPDLFYRKKGLA